MLEETPTAQLCFSLHCLCYWLVGFGAAAPKASYRDSDITQEFFWSAGYRNGGFVVSILQSQLSRAVIICVEILYRSGSASSLYLMQSTGNNLSPGVYPSSPE